MDMKLNNKGWGLSDMIICSAILIIALFFIVFYAFQFTKEKKVETTKPTSDPVQETITYPTIENSIREASLNYMDKYYYDDIGSGVITIPVSNLLYNHLLEESDLITSDKDTCDGYALVYKKNQDYEVEAYIKCAHYTTKEFQDWRIGEANE